MLFCEEIVMDPRTHRRLFVGLYDIVTPPALPYVLEKLNIFILLDCESKSVKEFAINIFTPSGKPFAACPAAMAEWASRTCECEPTFYDVVFREYGDYLVQVSLPDRVVFERALPVQAPMQMRSV